MKHLYFKNLHSILAAGLTLLALSCAKEEPDIIPKSDKESLLIKLEISGDPEDINGEVSLSAYPEDHINIDRIVFYANDDSLGQVKAEPYAITWNTTEWDDGPATVKAVAYDKSGNKGEAIKTIHLKNSFFTVYVGEGYISSRLTGNFNQYDLWMFLSDKQGNLIGDPQQVIDGTSLTWDRSLQPTEPFYLSYLTYATYSLSYDDKVPTSTIVTYSDVSESEVFLLTTESPTQEQKETSEVGLVNLNIENDFESDESRLLNLVFTETQLKFWLYGGITRNLSLTTPFDKISSLVTHYIPTTDLANNNGSLEKHYLWKEFEKGNTYHIHTKDFSPMDKVDISFSFPQSNSRVSSYGYMEEGYDVNNRYEFDQNYISSENKSTWAYYAGNLFPYITSELSVVHENGDYLILKANGRLPAVVEWPAFSAELLNADRKNIQLSTKGPSVLTQLSWQHKDDRNFSWYLRTDGQNTTPYVLPDIPELLVKKYSFLENKGELINPRYVTQTDYKAVDSYQDYIKQMTDNTPWGYEIREYTQIYSYHNTTAGGRQALSWFSTEEREKDYLNINGLFHY